MNRDKAEKLGELVDEYEPTYDEELDTFDRMLAERPSPVAEGVDLGPVTAAIPGFDGLTFLSVARESYLQLRSAWEHRDAAIAADLTTPEIAAQLARDIANDSAAHRHHLLPGVEIHNALITSAKADGKVVTIVVRMTLISEEYAVDDATNKIVDGDTTYHTWDEDWTFVRDLAVDESAEDREHALRPHPAGGWDFAHSGWNVAAITRVVTRA